MHRRRVAITGLGILAPNGCGKDAFWEACLQGRSGIQAITRFDTSMLATRIAGEITDFSPATFGLTDHESLTLDRSTQFAIAAANLALEDAGIASISLQEQERENMGVYLGTAIASLEKGEDIWLYLSQQSISGMKEPLPKKELTTFMLSYVPAAAIAVHHHLLGPCLTLSTGCSSGADALGQAFWFIQEGRADRMLAGGCDAALLPIGLSVFNVIHALSTNNDEPTRASRPYDARRDGFVLSEGAAVLLLEERELALARGAHIYAEIIAFSSNGNAYHMTALPADGAPLQMLLREVMQEALISPKQLGYINAHGSSTRTNDIAETVAYKGAFGADAYSIPISSTKSLIGHTQGAASAIEAAITALALDQQILPPTINLEVPDPQCDLDYIANVARVLPGEKPIQFALTHSSGFGGINTALILARHENLPRASDFEDEQTREIVHSALIRHPAVLSTSRPSISRRVVITGLGLVAPNGIGKEAFWQSVRVGRKATGLFALQHHTEHSFWPGGQIKDFRVEEYIE
ncbi:MAG TPA: beta-ketoacyl-[acyl-carrier-protein] synthase family protein, partial [Ktedonobacteraceae bacterium]|nr:beta-ketoacyl-[acyl-carrier-protein] synthase family protein [Ktedonobacteraceae bacterium]